MLSYVCRGIASALQVRKQMFFEKLLIQFFFNLDFNLKRNLIWNSIYIIYNLTLTFKMNQMSLVVLYYFTIFTSYIYIYYIVIWSRHGHNSF